jgi:hypothetical protein
MSKTQVGALSGPKFGITEHWEVDADCRHPTPERQKSICRSRRSMCSACIYIGEPKEKKRNLKHGQAEELHIRRPS